MKRLLFFCILIVIIMSSSGCLSGGDDVKINLSGTEEQALTLDDIKDLPYVEGYGGRKNSVGQITLPVPYKGVPLTEIYELDHEITEDSAIRIIAEDGYIATFSYNQFVLGDFVTYDEEGNEITAGELTIILAYEEDGKDVIDGPLRVVIIGPNGPITDGHWWVRYVSEIEAVNIEQ
ncbi:MAG: hypothetical protein JW825_00850 [Candidatus Methanofastidiosa archaeon]|nr:hypothetical protein [Candidatus Methanofastidiosa archaeon]